MQQSERSASRSDDGALVLRSLLAITRRGLVDARAGDTQLSFTDQSIVMAIAEEPGIRSTDIARMFRLNRSTVSRQLSSLIGLGLVQELPAASGRGRPLALTTEGDTAFRTTLRTLQQAIDTHLSEWTDAEVARFAHDLHRFDRGSAES
ncbi:MarR family winged helix-turn-helix transcriptional regulator [Microbacterium hydrocarbonoxydans]|uniref:DNA-binding transcriptional regulator, MarR family n=1 Tax=Microbacterium hydrocarbonoxydans TaxID=273678 RepID=A0A1H4MSG0_9MICO|nr:MarR family winged helix-turn-helix transcriptional regulator [Microbacterium hydrocarbonoxydans]SEB85578.1 DNA-binding transcriptional regulator, MarR family [Microbacterium hydrocarbonoxydans]